MAPRLGERLTAVASTRSPFAARPGLSTSLQGPESSSNGTRGAPGSTAPVQVAVTGPASHGGAGSNPANSRAGNGRL